MWRHAVLVVVLVMVGGLSAFAWSSAQETRYQAVVQVFLPDASRQSDDPSRIVRGEAQVLQSPTVLDRAVGLAGGTLTRKELQDRLTIEPAADTDLISIKVLDPSPRRSAALADDVALAYRQMQEEQARSGAERAVSELTRTEQRLSTELSALLTDQAANPTDPVLSAKVSAKDEQLKKVATDREQAEVTAEQSATDVGRAVAPAVVPDEPAQPKPLRTGALGAVLGLVLAAALSWWLASRPSPSPRPEPEPVRGVPAPRVSRHDRGPGPVDVNGEAAGVAGADRFTGSLQHVLDEWDERGELLRREAPLLMVEEIIAMSAVDEAVVLLDDGDGVRAWGRVGENGTEERPRGLRDRTLLDELAATGPKLVGDRDRARLVRAGIPGSAAETVLVVPLLADERAWAVLLAGRHSGGTTPDLDEADIAEIAGRAASLVPNLRSWVLVRRVRQRLSGMEATPESTEVGPG